MDLIKGKYSALGSFPLPADWLRHILLSSFFTDFFEAIFWIKSNPLGIKVKTDCYFLGNIDFPLPNRMNTTCDCCPNKAVYTAENDENLCKDCYKEKEVCDYCGEDATKICVETGCPCCIYCYDYGVKKLTNLTLGLTKCVCCCEWSKEEKKNEVCSECSKQTIRWKQVSK
jgi:hypothetical protein